MVSKDQLYFIASALLLFMQASIIVPMAVVWWRKRHFSPAVQRLSWYVYVSAFFVFAQKALVPSLTLTNYIWLAGFNFCKIALFAMVYHQVLTSARARRVVSFVTLVALLCIIGVYCYDDKLGVAFGRIMQCAVLAGFALLYLEQSLNRINAEPATRDPFWLLSVGQLLYSAGTVTAFSLDYLTVTVYDQSWKSIALALLGLVFNWFLTLAFLRAHRGGAPVEVTVPAGTQLAGS